MAISDPIEIAVTPLSEHLGGEISGVDARQIGHKIPLEAVKSLLFEYQSIEELCDYLLSEYSHRISDLFCAPVSADSGR